MIRTLKKIKNIFSKRDREREIKNLFKINFILFYFKGKILIKKYNIIKNKKNPCFFNIVHFVKEEGTQPHLYSY